jgi:Na+/proline symporter
LIIIFIALSLTGVVVTRLLPDSIGFTDALHVSGKLGKMNVITTGQSSNGFNWSDRYNIWSGLIGGFFLALSYFGTDQSQVGRYLTAKSNAESRLGLLINGLVKIPMQFFILLIGVLVFAFYQFNTAPLSFNDSLLRDAKHSSYKDSIQKLQSGFDSVNQLKKNALTIYTQGLRQGTVADDQLAGRIKELNVQAERYRSEFKTLSGKVSNQDGNDTNYIFLSFVKNYLPSGLKGLLIAIIFLAAWGSIAAALNSLAASTVVDFHHRVNGRSTPVNEYRISKWYTLAWGIFSIFIAQFASHLGQSLIEAVNVLGSLFYGVILGIFLVAFYIKNVHGTATFIASIITELFVVLIFFNEQISFLKWLPDISFLWLNVIGAIGVMGIAMILEPLIEYRTRNIEHRISREV